MKNTLLEIIEVFSLKQHMDEREHPITKSEVVDALWYLRNYRDLLMFVESMSKNEEFIKTHYLEDLKQ